MRRIYVTRAALAGVAATLAGGVALRLTAPDLADLAGAWIVVGAGLVAAFLFALLWDVIPPRWRPVCKAFVYGALLFGLLRLPLAAAPAVAIYALALGLAYRPHPAPPRATAPPLRPDPR